MSAPAADPASAPQASSSGQTADPIQDLVGGFGKYQLLLSLFLYLSKLSVVFGQLSIIFLAPKVVFTCADTGEKNKCPCDKPLYDRSVFKTTIISEWDLICEKKWKSSIVQTVLQWGTLIGSLMFGIMSDRHGRRHPLSGAIVINVISSILTAIIKNFWIFVVFRFLQGLSIGGMMVITFVIAMEFIGAEYRQLMSCIFHIPFNVGHMMLPWFSYFTREYQKFLLWLSVPTVILLSYLCLTPETPRWLLAMKRKEEAIKILTRVAKVNKRPTENIRSTVEAQQEALARQGDLKKGTMLDLFKTPNIRKNILIMAFTWMSCSYCFYGVTKLVGELSGDIFLNVTMSAALTAVGTLSNIPLMAYFGRRTLVIFFNFLCASCLIVVAFIPDGTISVILASVGQVSAFIVFIIVYLYCAELFPTVVRSSAMGFSSVMARVGSMIAPFVLLIQYRWMPVVFAILPLMAGLFAFFLPETKGCDLMTTIEEGESFGKKK